MKGVILAAGKGSRLYPVTRHIPKPLLPIVNRITLAYAFDQLKAMSITDICVVVGENEAIMKSALGDGSEYGVNLTYVRQNDPKGLAHAVGFTKEFVGDDSFVLYLGDAVYDRSLASFAEQFRQSNCANLNLIKVVEDPKRFGVATLDGDRIVKLVEKPVQPESNFAMAGMYFFGPQIWSVLPDLKPSARGEYEITDAIQMLIERGHDVRAGIYDGEWFDTGTLDSFLSTSAFLSGHAVHVGVEAELNSPFGQHVIVGDHAVVETGLIEDCVILPNSNVRVYGGVRHCILGGDISIDGELENRVIWSDEIIEY